MDAIVPISKSNALVATQSQPTTLALQQYNKIPFAGDIDAIITTTPADFRALADETASVTAAQNLLQNVKEIQRSPKDNVINVRARVLGSETFNNSKFGTGPTTKLQFQLTHIEARTQEEKEGGPLMSVKAKSSASIAWDAKTPAMKEILTNLQHCLAFLELRLIEKKKEAANLKAEGDSSLEESMDEDIDPLLKMANLSPTVRSKCLNSELKSCTYANTIWWAPCHPKPNSSGVIEAPKDKNIVPLLTTAEYETKVPLLLQKRPFADTLITLIHQYVTIKNTDHTFSVGDECPSKLKDGQEEFPRSGFASVIGLFHGVMITPQVPTHHNDDTNDIAEDVLKIHTLKPYFSHASHVTLMTFGDNVYVQWLIAKNHYCNRIPHHYDTLGEKALNNGKEFQLTVRVFPKHVAELIMLNQPAGQVLAFDVPPGQTWPVERVYCTASFTASNPSQICLRLPVMGQIWEKPVIKKVQVPTEVNLVSRLVVLHLNIWGNIIAPVFGFDPKDVPTWKWSMNHILRMTEFFFTGPTNEKEALTLEGNQASLPRNVILKEAQELVNRKGIVTKSATGESELSIAVASEAERNLALNLARDGYGHSPIFQAIDVKRVYCVFSNSLRRSALPVTHEAAQFIWKNYIANKSTLPIGAECNDASVKFISRKPLSGQEPLINGVDPATWEFRVLMSTMTADDLRNAGRMNPARVSKFFDLATIKLTGQPRTNWVNAEGLSEENTLACLAVPSNIKDASYLIWIVKRQDAKAQAAEILAKLAEIDSYLRPDALTCPAAGVSRSSDDFDMASTIQGGEGRSGASILFDRADATVSVETIKLNQLPDGSVPRSSSSKDNGAKIEELDDTTPPLEVKAKSTKNKSKTVVDDSMDVDESQHAPSSPVIAPVKAKSSKKATSRILLDDLMEEDDVDTEVLKSSKSSKKRALPKAESDEEEDDEMAEAPAKRSKKTSAKSSSSSSKKSKGKVARSAPIENEEVQASQAVADDDF